MRCQREEFLELLVIEIDDLGGVVIGDQPVEQRHLPFDFRNIGAHGVLGRKLRQRSGTFIKIERRDRAAFVNMKIRHQPRQQGLADSRPWRSKDGD